MLIYRLYIDNYSVDCTSSCRFNSSLICKINLDVNMGGGISKAIGELGLFFF